MDSYTSAQRYVARRTVPYRRPAKHHKTGRMRRLIAFQIIICIILFLILLIIKNTNISVARLLTDRVRHTLSHNVEFEDIPKYLEALAVDIRNSVIQGPSEDTVTDMPTYAQEDGANGRGETNTTAASNSITAGARTQVNSAVYPDRLPVSEKAANFSDIEATYSGEETEYKPNDPEVIPRTSVLSASIEDNAASINEKVGIGMSSPVEGMLVTPFGEIMGATGIVKMHRGIDIAVEGISDVKAALDGYIIDHGASPGYGGFVEVRHDNGLTTVYANCSSVIVQKNDIVKKGDVIARVGEDSMTGGSHLHFEVWYVDDPVDPVEYISVTAR